MGEKNDDGHLGPFSNGVMSSSIVDSSIFLASDELLGMKQLSVGSGANFVDDSGFQIDENSTWHMFACSGLGEEGCEGIITCKAALAVS